MEIQQKTQTKENKMGVMPVNRLLITMSVPMMISMLVQALYNIVDSMFVAQLNESALTAVSLAFPVQNLMIAVASGTGVGVNALLSRSLGEKNTEYANKVANNGILLSLFSAVIFAVLTGLFSSLFFTVQTDNPEIIRYGIDYVRVCGILSFGIFSQIMMERLLQSTGKTIYSMLSQITGAIINIILDPIMIFGLFGFPRLEVTGAALATVTGQIIAALFGLYLNVRKNKELKISPVKYRFSLQVVKGIYKIGVPSIIMLSIGSVMTFSMNKILMAFTSTATAVFGVYFKLQSFIFMPIIGMNNGMVPIVAYNYGARNPERIIRVIKLSVMYAVSIMLLGFFAFQFFAESLLGIFNASEAMLEIGRVALRIISIHFVIAGFCIISCSVFQALGNGVLSMIVSICRQLLALLPSAYILARIGGLSAVWWSFGIAEVVSAILCAVFLRKIYRNTIKPLYN